MANRLGSLLDEAKQTITGERKDRYGRAEDSFGMIAGFWSTYLGAEISKRDAAIMLALFKLARGKVQPAHRDNDRDAVGYVAIAADILASKPAPEPKSSEKGWEYCPSCGGVLDTGWECLGCKADWRGFAALHPGIEPAPEPERSCGTCLNTWSGPGSACERCDDFSEWTDG